MRHSKTETPVSVKKFARQDVKVTSKVANVSKAANVSKVANVSKGKPESKGKPAINPSLAYCPKQFGKVFDHGNYLCIEGFKKGVTKKELLKKLQENNPANEKTNERRLYKAIWRLKQIGVIVSVKNGVYKI